MMCKETIRTVGKALVFESLRILHMLKKNATIASPAMFLVVKGYQRIQSVVLFQLQVVLITVIRRMQRRGWDNTMEETPANRNAILHTEAARLRGQTRLRYMQQRTRKRKE